MLSAGLVTAAVIVVLIFLLVLRALYPSAENDSAEPSSTSSPTPKAMVFDAEIAGVWEGTTRQGDDLRMEFEEDATTASLSVTRDTVYSCEGGVAEVTEVSGRDYELAMSEFSPGPCLGVEWGASRLVRAVARVESNGDLQVDLFSSDHPGADPRETLALQPAG